MKCNREYGCGLPKPELRSENRSDYEWDASGTLKCNDAKRENEYMMAEYLWEEAEHQRKLESSELPQFTCYECYPYEYRIGDKTYKFGIEFLKYCNRCKYRCECCYDNTDEIDKLTMNRCRCLEEFAKSHEEGKGDEYPSVIETTKIVEKVVEKIVEKEVPVEISVEVPIMDEEIQKQQLGVLSNLYSWTCDVTNETKFNGKISKSVRVVNG